MQERDKLQSQVDTLRTTVVLSDISLPAEFEGIPAPSAPQLPLSGIDMPATVSYGADDLNHQRLHVNFPRQIPCQGMDYPSQTYPPTNPYQGNQLSGTPQPGQDLPNGWFFPYRINFSG